MRLGEVLESSEHSWLDFDTAIEEANGIIEAGLEGPLVLHSHKRLTELLKALLQAVERLPDYQYNDGW